MAMCGDAPMMLAASRVDAARQLASRRRGGGRARCRSEPVLRSAARKPFASASMPMNTATTSAMPSAVSAVETGRCSTLRALYIQWDLHSTVLSACTTGSRAARIAGTTRSPASARSATPAPRSSVLGGDVEAGEEAAALKFVVLYSSFGAAESEHGAGQGDDARLEHHQRRTAGGR